MPGALETAEWRAKVLEFMGATGQAIKDLERRMLAAEINKCKDCPYSQDREKLMSARDATIRWSAIIGAIVVLANIILRFVHF